MFTETGIYSGKIPTPSNLLSNIRLDQGPGVNIAQGLKFPSLISSASKPKTSAWGEAWGKGGAAWGILGGLSQTFDSIGKSDANKRGLWDIADPFHYLTGGRESNVGGAVGDIGVSLTKTGLLLGNPWLAMAGGITKGVGSLIDAGWGVKANQANIDYIKNNTTTARNAGNAFGRATTTGDFFNAAGKMTASSGLRAGDLYKNGWFTSSGTRKGNALIAKENAALAFLNHSMATGATNVNTTTNDNVMSNFSAYGGPIDTIDPSTPIGYAIYTDRMINKRNTGGIPNLFAGMPNNAFAFGGDVEAGGGTFSTGLTHIDTGLSHERNPNGGVPMGTDSLGVPNLLEEGEVVYDDYVFSNRLVIPRGKRGRYSKGNMYAEGGKLELGGKGKLEIPYEDKVLKPYEGMTFAKAAKKAEKDSGVNERPNDHIARSGFEAILSVLAGALEKEREKERLEEMKKAIDNMTPEEFAALQQQQEMLAALEQLAQMLQLAEALAAASQQLEMSPEEVAMMQQQLAMAQAQLLEVSPEEAAAAQLMAAYGGQLYALGGPIAKVAKHHNLTEEEWNKLDEAVLNRYIRQYQHSLKRADRKAFETEMAAYKDNLLIEKELADYREAQKNSTLTKDDIKNLTYEQKVKLGRALDPKFNADSYKTMNQRETLDDDLVKLSEKNKVTLGQLNETLAPSSAHKDWQIVNPDEAWSRSIDWNTPLYGENTPVPVEAGNTRGHYRPRNWVNNEGKIVVGDNTYDDMKSYELSDEYLKPRYELAKSAAAQDEAGKKLWLDYVEGLNPDYAASYDPNVVFGKDYAGNLLDYNTFKKYIQDNYETLNKANADGIRSGFFDQIAGLMHGTYGTKQARELYLMKGNEGTYLNPEGNWRDNYSIVNTENKDDGTTIYTLDPKGMYFNRVEGTPEGLEVSPDGTIVRTGNLDTDNNPFPDLDTWPYWLGAGLLAAALGYNIFTDPDYSNVVDLVNAGLGAGRYKPVEFKPIGNYLTYKPFDIWLEQNRLNANARATDRSILNSGVSQGAQNAALIANAYTNQIADGNVHRQGLEYDNNLEKQTVEHNTDVDKFNSTGFLDADKANQDAALKARGYKFDAEKEAALLRQRIDDARGASISSGVTGLGNMIFNWAALNDNNKLFGWSTKTGAYGPISGYGNEWFATQEDTDAKKRRRDYFNR